MTCGCGHENPAGAKFCLECGSSLAHRCAECGTELPGGAKFCLECGHPVAVPGAAADAEARHEVRKVVTVVFVDLAGSTSLQEHMDPESVRRVMDRFYAQMRTEIEGAGGLVVKFTGDGVMAGFGIREAGEDDALRAVHAAARMQEAFAGFAGEIAAERGADVALRIGVNTGEVVVSESDDDVVGDVVNVAARLEHAAGDGNVLVGEETRRLTRHAVTYESVEPLDLKGKAEPVPAYRLVSLEAPPEEEAAPFVGRTAELARLREVFEASVASAAPGIVTVVGSPGLGKTRLAAELAASVSDRARILEARCYAATTATYAPIAEALREAAGIPETATAEEVVSALEVLLPADFPERSRIAKLTASVLGVGEAAAPQETFWATRRLLEGLSAMRPLVLIVDDVQWAEPMLLDLFDHIVEWAKGAAIVIVALARPEIREVRPSLLDAGAIVLEGLDPGDTAALAASLLGAHDLPEALVRRILEATEGNPLFVRELLRMLVDDGVLSRDGERWTITVEASEIDVPPTIHALLAARIERLHDDERSVMERASVVGKEFYRGAVLDLVPPGVGSGLDAHLETLRRKELVEPEGTYWIDERVFRFHHVLIRDAAYRRLLKEARAELHERFADWLEAKVGDLVGEHEEVLGYHLEQAHTYRAELGSSDDHTVGLGRRAATHLASATARALDRDDLTAAAQLSARALALTDDEGARAGILLDRCEALLGMGQVGTATGAVTELRAQAADERLVAWADCFDGQLAVLTDPSRLRSTAAAVEDAARRLTDLGDTAGAAKAHAVHAQALAHLGQFGACEAALDRALAAAREAGDRRRANAVLASAPLAALWGPSPVPRASGRCLDVVRVLRITAGAPAVEATALRCQAVLEAMRGRTEAAHRMLASSRETLEELGLRHALVECDLFGGLIDLFAGDVPAAEASFRAAREGFRALNIGTDTAQAAALLARTLVDQHEDDEALALTEESERLGGDDLKTAIAWRCVRARVLARRGETEAAIDLARAAVALAEPTDALIDHADALLALAEVLSAAGREEEARAGSRKGAELLARKEARVAEQARSAEPPAALERGRVRIAPGVDPNGWDDLYNSLFAAYVRRDWKAVEAHVVPDYTVSNQQSGLRVEITSGAEYVEYVRAIYERENEWTVDLLGVNGDRSLARLRAFGPGDDATGPWEVFRVLVAERNSDGLFVRSDWFDEADMDRARDLLGGESPHELLRGVRPAPGVSAVETVALLERYRRVLLARDWDGMTQLYSEELVVIDHRSGLRAETVGRRAWVDAMQATWQDVESEWDFEVLGEWPEGVALSRVRSRGPGWERDYLMLTAISDGLCSRTEIFDADGHISALARLDELAYESSTAKTAIDAYVSAPNEHDWTEVDPIVGSGTAVLVSVDGSFAVMSATEGRVTEVELFDGDDEIGARKRLHELAPGPSYVSWLVRHHFDRHARQDWEALRALNAPNVLLVDHRPVGRGAIEGVDRALEFLQEDARAASMAPGELGITEWLAISPDGALVRFRRARTAPDGVDLDRLLLMRVRSRDGLLVRSYMYNPDQIDDARRLMSGADIFHRAAPGVDADLSLYDQARAAMLARDREAMLALFTPDHVFVDHRGGLQSEVLGPVEFLSGSAATYQGLEFGRTIEILSMWTDDISLSRVTSWGDGWKIGSLVMRVTCDGLWCRTEQFDEADWDGALSRLDELSYESSVAKPAIDRYVSAPNEHGWDSIAPIVAAGSAALVRVTDPGGRGSLAVVDTADGQIRGVEPFDLDDELAARRRLHELAPSASFVAWRVRYQFDRHAHQDWDAFRSLFPPDITLVDHRPIGWGTVHGIDRILEFLQEGAKTAAMTPDGLWVTEWLAITKSKTLYRYRWAGTSPDGVGFGFDRLMLTDLGGGVAEIFDPEQIDMARRRMAGEVIADTGARARSGGVRAGPGVDAVRAVDGWTGFRDAMLARDWDAMLRIFTPGHVLVDRRSGLRSELHGGQAWVDAMRSIWQEVESDWDIEVLAAWSDDVFLSRVGSFGDGWERAYLAITVARGDVLDRSELFDEDDHATAFARLDSLVYERSSASLAVDSYLSTSSDRDHHGLSAAVPIAGFGDVALLRVQERTAVVQTSDGKIVGVEFFDADDELGARRRLQELAPSPSYLAWSMQYYFDIHTHQDWDALRVLWAPGVTVVDHRPVGWGEVRGADRVLEFLQEGARTAEMRPGGLWVTRLLALTSDAALYRYRWEGTSPDGVEFGFERLMLTRYRDGGAVHSDIFDPEQIDEAYRRMAATRVGLGPVTGRYAEVFNSRAWDRAREVWAPDYFVIDHRPAAFARRDLTAFVEGMKAFVDLAPNVQVDPEPIFTSPSAEVAILHMRGETREGAAFVLDIGAATRVVDDLGIVAVTFVPDDVEAATRWATDHSIGFEKEDFEALRARPRLDATADRAVPSVHTPPDGRFAEFGRRWQEAFEAGAEDEFAALYTPGFEVTEHQHHVTLNLEGHLEEMRRAAAHPNSKARVDNIVCLGTRHGVNRTTFSLERVDVNVVGTEGHDWSSTGASEIGGVSAVRLDDEGRCLRFEWFPSDQLHRALARAEELYIEDEATGEALAGARRRLRFWRMADAHNDGNWEAFARSWAPDVVFVDRRQLGWGVTKGRDAVVELICAIQARSVRHVWSISEVHAIADDACVCTLPTEGVDRDGARYEQGGVAVAMLSDEGVSRAEIFAFDAVDEALERFAELRREAPATAKAAGTPSNAYTRVYRSFHDTLRRADWEAAEAFQAPDIILEDRRSGLRDSLAGRDALLRNQSEAINLGYTLDRFEPIATRGDRLAIVRILWTLGEDSEIEMLVVGEMDEQDRISTLIVFDPDDLEAASAEVDERYLATLPPTEAEVWRAALRMQAIYNEHDLAGWAAGFHSDVLVVDHRPVGWGSFQGTDDMVSVMRGLVDLIPDARGTVISVERLSDRVALHSARTAGTDVRGGFVELLYFMLWVYRDGKFERYELFPIDEREAALARFDELAATGTTLEQTWDRSIVAMNAGDMEAFGELLAREFRIHNHGYHLELDRDGQLENVGKIAEAGGRFRRERTVPLGDRHGVIEMVWSGTLGAVGESEVANWYAARCDLDGRLSLVHDYAEPGFLEALERADGMYLEDEATATEAEWCRVRLERLWRTFLAYNAGEWDAFAAQVPPDFVTIDHRPASLVEFPLATDAGSGRMASRDEWLEWLRTMTEVAVEPRFEIRSVHLARDVVLLDMASTGTNDTGGPVENAMSVVVVLGVRQELFAPEQRGEAEKRFLELVEESRSSTSRASSTTIERSWDP